MRLVHGRRVLEVGSQNVNGSIRPWLEFMQPQKYLGIDIEPGPGVDKILSIHDLATTYGRTPFDLVLCTEVLEHVADWRSAIRNLKAACKPGGYLIITTRRPGFPRHEHPNDYWRYTANFLQAAFQDWEVLQTRDLLGHGVAIITKKPETTQTPDPTYHPALHPTPAPTKFLTPRQQRWWVRWAYRLTNPHCQNIANPPQEKPQ